MIGCVHVPPPHTSAVHEYASAVHDAVLFGCVHAPPLQMSFVQALPSSVHEVALFENTHAPAVVPVHVSVVHTFESPHVFPASSDHAVVLVAAMHSLQGSPACSTPFE